MGEKGELISLYPDEDLKTHRQHVEAAIAAGHQVPDEVLKDHPGIKPRRPKQAPE